MRREFLVYIINSGFLCVVERGNGEMQLAGYRINVKLTRESRKIVKCAKMWQTLHVDGLLPITVKNEVHFCVDLILIFSLFFAVRFNDDLCMKYFYISFPECNRC